jgi:hypothetical protein
VTCVVPATRLKEMSMESKATDIKGRIQEGLSQLATLRDDIKVRIHLAELEVKDEWKKLEPKLFEVEQAAKGFSESSQRALEEVVGRLKHLKDSLKA